MVDIKIIGLIGKARSGKDTIADYITKHSITYKKRAFADALKEKAMKDFNLTYNQVYGDVEKEIIIDEWGKSPRQILQVMGTDWYRSINPNYWVDIWEKDIFGGHWGNKIVVPDVRFPNEIEAILRNKGKIIRVVRPNQTQIENSNHISETALDNFTAPNFEIVNDGTKEALYTNIDTIIQRMWE